MHQTDIALSQLVSMSFQILLSKISITCRIWLSLCINRNSKFPFESRSLPCNRFRCFLSGSVHLIDEAYGTKCKE